MTPFLKAMAVLAFFALIGMLTLLGCTAQTPRFVTDCHNVGEFVSYTPSYRSTLVGKITTTKGEFEVNSWENIMGLYGEPVEMCRDSLTGPFVTIGGRRY